MIKKYVLGFYVICSLIIFSVIHSIGSMITVGFINFTYSLFISLVYIILSLKIKKIYLIYFISAFFVFLQYFTPYPFYVCYDSEYRFCYADSLEIFDQNIYNVIDVLIYLWLFTAYLLAFKIWGGGRARAVQP